MKSAPSRALKAGVTAASAFIAYFIIFPWVKLDHAMSFTLIIAVLILLNFLPKGSASQESEALAVSMLSDDYMQTEPESSGQGHLKTSIHKLKDKQRRLFADIYGMTLTAAAHGKHLETDTQRIRSLSSEVVQAIGEVTHGNTHVAGLIEEITVQTGQVNRFIHDIGDEVVQISGHAGHAEALAKEGQQSLAVQKDAVDQTLETFNSIHRVVGSLEEAATEIGSIAGTISAIASETNLLALNAAIEAARAGEAGRGFAVVADEIRKLAGNTNAATVQVGSLISRVRQEVSAIVSVVGDGFAQVSVQAEIIEKSGAVFENITEAVIGTARELDAISVKSEELIRFSETIQRAIENIAAVSQETAAGAEEVNASMEDQVSAMELVHERLTDYSAKAGEVMSLLKGIRFIRMAQSDYEEHILQVEILRQLAQAHLNIAVEGIRIPIEELFHSMAVGTTDASVAPWMPSGQGEYSKYKDRIVSLGTNMTGCSTGLVVPSYVEAQRIEDIRGNESRFGGTLYSCYRTVPLGARATEAVQVYGLNLKMEYCNEQQLLAALKRRQEKKEWVVITGWQPHAMVGEYNLKFLKDSREVFGVENHCDTFTRRGLEQDLPAFVAFLKNFRLDVKGINEALGHVSKGMTMEDAAAGYISRYWTK